MASFNSTIDGMGFEEVNQASSTEIISGTNIYGTTGSFVTTKITTANVVTGNITTVVATTGSAVTTRNTNINFIGSCTDTNTGRLKSNLIGSATTKVYGAYIQAGSFDTTAGSLGFINFGTPYTSATSYYVNAIPTGSITGYEKSYISGVRHISGVNFVGAAALRYDYIAVGI